VQLNLVDVPEMGYTSNDQPRPRGELCIRGQACVTEYLNDPEKTKELIDEEGWLHSGDVAEIDECGRFKKIIDRIKNLVKLSQGEYVALEKVENAYSLSPLVAQIYVHGDSLQHYLVAIVVPSPETYPAFASKILKEAENQVNSSSSPPNGVVTNGTIDLKGNKAALVASMKNPKVVAAFLDELNKQAKKADLTGFEKVKAIALTGEPFTMENDLLTPTFKVKRNIASKRFRETIDNLYKSSS